MKTGVNNLKKGNVILINKVLHEVIDYYNTQPGKGGAFSQIKLRNMDTGSIFEKRFRTSESVERAHLDDKEVQYLYSDGTDFHFMDNNLVILRNICLFMFFSTIIIYNFIFETYLVLKI